MGQATNQIEAQIENRRADLGSNLRELERKVKSVTDWKHHFQENPMTLLGVAFGGGILLAATLGGRKRRRGTRSYSAVPDGHEHAGTEPKHRAMEAWDNIKGALVGVAATRFKDFVGEIVPGFHEEFRQAERKATPHNGPSPVAGSPAGVGNDPLRTR
jgi:hypothetical protein